MKKKFKEMIIQHEGIELKPYVCTAGKLTIGIGRNLEERGISPKEAFFLFENDLEEIAKSLNKYPWFLDLSEARQAVIMDMVFNLGLGGFLRFKKTISLIEKGDFLQASIEMLNSKWANQVGKRADRLSEIMRTGEFE